MISVKDLKHFASTREKAILKFQSFVDALQGFVEGAHIPTLEVTKENEPSQAGIAFLDRKGRLRMLPGFAGGQSALRGSVFVDLLDDEANEPRFLISERPIVLFDDVRDAGNFYVEKFGSGGKLLTEPQDVESMLLWLLKPLLDASNKSLWSGLPS